MLQINAADNIRQQPVCGAAAQQHRGDLVHEVIGHGGDPKIDDSLRN